MLRCETLNLQLKVQTLDLGRDCLVSDTLES